MQKHNSVGEKFRDTTQSMTNFELRSNECFNIALDGAMLIKKYFIFVFGFQNFNLIYYISLVQIIF